MEYVIAFWSAPDHATVWLNARIDEGWSLVSVQPGGYTGVYLSGEVDPTVAGVWITLRRDK